MNVGLMIFSAVVTTGALIFITEFAGRRYSNYFKKFLVFIAIWPFMIVLIQLLLTTLTDPESVGAAGIAATDKIMAVFPESIVSGYIGEAVGFIVWSVYRWTKRLRRLF